MTDIFDTWIAQGYTLTYFNPRPNVGTDPDFVPGVRVHAYDTFDDVGVIMEITPDIGWAWVQYDRGPGNRECPLDELELHEDQTTPINLPCDRQAYSQPIGPDSPGIFEDRMQWMLEGGHNAWREFPAGRSRMWG